METLTALVETFQRAWDDRANPVLVVDARGRLLYVSPEAAAISGYSTAELIGRRGSDLLCKRSRLGAAQDFAQVSAGIPILRDEACLIRKDSRRVWLIYSLTPLWINGHVKGAVGAVLDVTPRRRAEQERLDRERSLREAQVNEVHHRIKNNLQGLVGLIRRQMRRHPGAADALEGVLAQLRSVVMVYGLQETQRGPVELDELVRRIAAAAHELQQAPLAPCLRLNGGGLRLAEHETVPLALVINELILNALKHSPQPLREPIVIESHVQSDGAILCIDNPGGRLPAGFDLDRASGFGTGLKLVASLMPRQSRLSLQQHDDGVRVVLRADPPVVLPAADSQRA